VKNDFPCNYRLEQCHSDRVTVSIVIPGNVTLRNVAPGNVTLIIVILSIVILSLSKDVEG
jgi:hypothetical protein